jgi:putative aldouronate transport system permease protein
MANRVIAEKGKNLFMTTKTMKIFTSSRAKLGLMVAPFVIFVIVFSYVPIFGWIYAFFDYRPGVGLTKVPFVGLKYFIMAFNLKSGSDLLQVFRNTFMMSFLGLLTSPLPVIFAICLTEMNNRFFKKAVQTMTTLPNFISWILVFAIAFETFSISDGFVNQILLNWKILKDPINPLASSDGAWFFQTGLGLWKGLGFSAIIYLAAIGGIDTELYDAADIDGAGRFQKMRYVTVPGLAPTYIVLLLLAVSNILSNGFDQYYAFMNAMVRDKLQVFDYYIYRVGIGLNEYSLGTALGIFKTVVSVSLLFGVNWLSKKIRGVSII